MAGDKYYSVRVGRVPGVYATWPDCQQQTKGYSRAKFKSFYTLSEAEQYLKNGDALREARASYTPQQDSCERRAKRGIPLRNNTTTARRELQREINFVGFNRPLNPGEEAVTRGSEEGTSEGHNEMYTLHFDGASKGNPGAAGSGALLTLGSQKVLEVLVGGGPHQTNNVAEYVGVIEGLKAARSLGVEHLKVWGDSKLVVEQVYGRYNVNERLRPLCKMAQELKMSFKSCELQHMDRLLNKDADELANEAVHLPEGKVWRRIPR